jgi:hypothetical protein
LAQGGPAVAGAVELLALIVIIAIPHRPVDTRRATGPRGSLPRPLRQQRQADRPGTRAGIRRQCGRPISSFGSLFRASCQPVGTFGCLREICTQWLTAQRSPKFEEGSARAPARDSNSEDAGCSLRRHAGRKPFRTKRLNNGVARSLTRDLSQKVRQGLFTVHLLSQFARAYP